MSDKVRIVLHIDSNSAEILDQAVTPRQKGNYISQLIRDAQNAGADKDSRDIYVRLDELSAGVRRIEKKMAG